MDKKRKPVIIFGIILMLCVMVFLLVISRNNRFRKRIPELTETAMLSSVVKEQLDDAYTIAIEKPTADNIGRLGMIYHSMASYAEAAECYKLAVERKRSDWIWHYYYGYLSIEMGNSGAAIEIFNEVVEKDPNNYHAWYYLGEEYKNKRNYNLAEEAYEQAVASRIKPSSSVTNARSDHFPLSAYARFKLARLYVDTGRFDEAEKTLQKLIKDEYMFGSAYRLLGTVYLTQGIDSLGHKYINRANDLITFSSPVDTLADKLAAISRSELYLLKKIDEAERSIHSDWALQLVTQGLNYIPENRNMLSKAIKIYLWKGYFEKANALTDKHISLFPNDYIEIKNTGMLFYQKSQYKQAVKYWEKALELKPDEHVVQLYLVQSYFATGEKQKGEKLLEDMEDRYQDNPEIMANVTDLLFESGEKKNATKWLNRLQQMAPSHPKVLRMMGDRAVAEGLTSKALSHYEASLRGDPGDIKAIQSYGDLLMEKEMWDRYISHLIKALNHLPNNPKLLGRLGEILISCPDAGLRNVEDGKEFSERAFTCFNCPVDVMISSGSHLAYAHALLGDKQKALETITKTISIGRKEKIAAPSMEKLENFYRTLQGMNN